MQLTPTQQAVQAAVNMTGATFTQQINNIIASAQAGVPLDILLAALQHLQHTTNNNLVRIQLAAYSPDVFESSYPEQVRAARA